MLKAERQAYATFALMVLAGLAGVAPADAQAENSRETREHRAPERERQAAGREAQARQSRRTYSAHVQAAHAAARREAAPAVQHPMANDHRQMVGHSIGERQLTSGSAMRETHLTGGAQVRAARHGFAGGQVRVVRYGNTLSGTVERSAGRGLVSRTFVSGGHVLYTHVYQQHVWYQFGRALPYEMFVPAVRYPAVYYSWALATWPRPVSYTWGWQVQPWYPTYGALFTPYPVYTSPDLWMTDYIIARNMQMAYQAQTAPPAPEPPVGDALAAPASDSSGAGPAVSPGAAAPVPQPNAAPQALQTSDSPPAPPAPPAPAARPPLVTPQIKAQLNTQIKVQLQEQQAAAATPVTLTTQSTPPALRPNHVFFEVVQPLEVSSGSGDRYCSLSPNDYIKRTGGMSADDWMIPVVVELSEPADCPAGLQTRIGLNDLNAMENEQEAQVLEAMQAASKSMGPNGPHSDPGVHPTLIAAGNAGPDPSALDAIRQAQ